MARLFSIDGDGIKNIDLPQYPDEAWTWYSGKPQNGAEQTLYQRVAYLFQCAQVTAAATAQVPFAVIRTRDGVEVDNSANWKNIVGWLPNPRRTINKVELALYIWGRAYSYPSKTKKGKDLQYILPTSVEPVIDGAEGLTGFTRTYTGGVKRWTVEDLIYYWEDDPFVEIGPPQSSRFMAAASAASVLHEMDKYIAEFIARGGVLPTMLMVKGAPPASERERIEDYWNKFIRGWFKVVGKIFSAEGFDVKTVGDGLASLKDANFTAQERENITVASRVPMSIIMSDQETYAGAMASRLNWFQNSIVPNFDFIADTWNEQLLQPMGYRVVSRPETMDAYQEDEAARATAYATYVGAGVLPSIAARLVGLDMPPDVEYTDLDPQPEPETPEAEGSPEDDAEDMTEEAEEIPEPAKAAQPLSLDAIRDLEIWRRKAIKAIATGDPVAFTTTAIPDAIYQTVTAGLAQAQTVEDVRQVFAGVTGQPQPETRTDDTIKALLEGIRLGVEALNVKASYTPPAEVRAAARRGLELREKHGKGGLTTQEAGAQGIGSGVQRASDLASGDAVSLETVRRMAAFFARHEKNKSGGEDDAGYIAWQLWGGDAGRAWAEGIIREIEEKEGDK